MVAGTHFAFLLICGLVVEIPLRSTAQINNLCLWLSGIPNSAKIWIKFLLLQRQTRRRRFASLRRPRQVCTGRMARHGRSLFARPPSLIHAREHAGAPGWRRP